jgi:Flp pilus assembly protein TadG
MDVRSNAPSGRRRGQSAVEFALILPVFLLLVAGTIEFGRSFFAYGQLLQAVQGGVRYGAVLGNATNDAAIISRVRQVSPGGAADTVTVSSTVSPSDNTAVAAANRQRGNVLLVSATNAYSPAIPFFPLRTMNLTASASMVVE